MALVSRGHDDLQEVSGHRPHAPDCKEDMFCTSCGRPGHNSLFCRRVSDDPPSTNQEVDNTSKYFAPVVTAGRSWSEMVEEADLPVAPTPPEATSLPTVPVVPALPTFSQTNRPGPTRNSIYIDKVGDQQSSKPSPLVLNVPNPSEGQLQQQQPNWASAQEETPVEPSASLFLSLPSPIIEQALRNEESDIEDIVVDLLASQVNENEPLGPGELATCGSTPALSFESRRPDGAGEDVPSDTSQECTIVGASPCGATRSLFPNLPAPESANIALQLYSKFAR